MPAGSQQGRDINEANIIRQGLATAAAQDGASSGDAATVGPDGELLFASAGGGSQPLSWAVLSLANCPAFNTSTTFYYFQQADITIVDQSDDNDFTLGIGADTNGAIITAAGGWFQAGAYLGTPDDPVLDAGTTTPRWLHFGASTGDAGGNPTAFIGMDQFVPISDVATIKSAGVISVAASVPGKAAAGGRALQGIYIDGRGLVGTDSVPNPISEFYRLVLWKIAAS